MVLYSPQTDIWAVIKTDVSIPYAAKALGMPILKDGVNDCPFCKRKRKLSLYDDGRKYYCHHPGCPTRKIDRPVGTVIDYCIANGLASNHIDALSLLKPLLGNVSLNNQQYKIRSNTLLASFEFYQEAITDEVLDFLNSRGYSTVLETQEFGYAPSRNYLQNKGMSKHELLEAKLVKEDGREVFNQRVIFPIYDDRGRLVHLQGRAIDPNTEPRWLSLASSESAPSISTYLFNQSNAINHDNKEVLFLTEGISDGLSLLELFPDRPTVSCFGVEVNLTKHYKLFSTYENLVCILDSDRYPIGTGKDLDRLYKSWSAMLKHLVELKKVLPSLQIWCIILPAKFGKDVNDWLQTGVTSEQARDFIIDSRVSLEEFAIHEYGHRIEYHPLLLSLVDISLEFKDKLTKKIIDHITTDLADYGMLLAKYL